MAASDPSSGQGGRADAGWLADPLGPSVLHRYDEILAEALPALFGGVALLLLGFSLFLRVTDVPPRSTTVADVHLASGLVLAAIFLALHRWSLPARLAHPIAFLLGGAIYVNTLASVYIPGDPLQVLDVVVTLLLAGAILLSVRWFLASAAISILVFAAVRWSYPGLSAWPTLATYLGVALVASTALLLYRRNLHRDLFEAERTLEARGRENVQLLTENLDEATWLASADGSRFLYANPAFETVYGVDRSSFLPDPTIVLDVIHPDDREVVAHAFQVAQGGYTRITYRLRRADGEVRWVESELTPVLTDAEGARRIVGLSRDITGRVRDREALRAYAARLERATTDLEELAHSAAHELQEPIRDVVRFTQRLSTLVPEVQDPEVAATIATIEAGGHRLHRRLQALLRYLEMDAREPEVRPVRLGEMVDEVAAVLAAERQWPALADHLRHDALPAVAADPRDLRVLLTEVLRNAVVFGHAPGSPAEVRVGAERRDGSWILTVEDRGPGIAPQHRERILRPFQRLDRGDDPDASGMGLALARKAAERNGGRIWVDEAAGGGTAVHASLPVDPIAVAGDPPP